MMMNQTLQTSFTFSGADEGWLENRGSKDGLKTGAQSMAFFQIVVGGVRFTVAPCEESLRSLIIVGSQKNRLCETRF